MSNKSAKNAAATAEAKKANPTNEKKFGGVRNAMKFVTKTASDAIIAAGTGVAVGLGITASVNTGAKMAVNAGVNTYAKKHVSVDVKKHAWSKSQRMSMGEAQKLKKRPHSVTVNSKWADPAFCRKVNKGIDIASIGVGGIAGATVASETYDERQAGGVARLAQRAAYAGAYNGIIDAKKDEAYDEAN